MPQPQEDIPALKAPEHILAKIPETVRVELSGRQCRVIKWAFNDFLAAADLLPELPIDLLTACREVATFSGLHAGESDDGHEKVPIAISVLHAHFIAFALTLEMKSSVPSRRDLVETIKDISIGLNKVKPKRKQ